MIEWTEVSVKAIFVSLEERNMNRIPLDVRGLEPPEPAKRIVDELQYLMKGDVLEVRGDKPFKNLIPMLEERGYGFEMEELGGDYMLRIWDEGDAKPMSPDDVECGSGNIDENTNVGKLLKEHPEAMQILIDAGFTPLKNPAMRHLASTVSLKTAAKMIGMDEKGLKALVERLNSL